MKPEPKYTQQDLDKAGEAAKSLLKEALARLEGARKNEAAAEARLFFPNGIQLIEIEVKVQNIVEVHLIISGMTKSALAEGSSVAAVTASPIPSDGKESLEQGND